jgi:DNA-binding response OmpR family regulator
MRQVDKDLRILVLDSDETFKTELRSLGHPGIAIEFPDVGSFGDIKAGVTDRDVVVVSTAGAAGLALVADLCAHASAPPVIAVGGAGFEGKSLEHVLLLAELRGAVAALPKPIEASELVLAASQVQRCSLVGQKSILQRVDLGPGLHKH